MSMLGRGFSDSSKHKAVMIVVCFLLFSLSPMLSPSSDNYMILADSNDEPAFTGTVDPWVDGGQPWPQSARVGERTSQGPAHSPNGGAGTGDPENASELMSVVDPVVNWVYGTYTDGTDSLGTPIANFDNQIISTPESENRCGGDSLFLVLIQTDNNGDSQAKIIEGEDAELAWEVDLGQIDLIKSSPVIVDIDDDGIQEMILVYDSGGSIKVDAYSPRLQCLVTGWSPGGSKTSELLWTWSDSELKISANPTSSTNGLFGNRPTTQPLLADLDLDGDAELVLATTNDDQEPVVVALPLAANGAPTPLWQSTLGDGTHPSDPAFAQIDDSTGYVLLTTIQESSGAMWVWKLDSSSGDKRWSGLSLFNLDGNNDIPHIRLPGPIIANLDTDETPEMIITIPTDGDDSSSTDGAEFRGLEIDDGSEIWSIEAVNGYTDAPPLAIDTDEDGEIDRVCWVSWHQETTTRHGHTGCHDVSGTNPSLEWENDIDPDGGWNDGIAVSQPIWMDIDGSGVPELLVAYGRNLWAWDGDTGTRAAINDNWNNEVELDHRTWSSPSLADVDGDAIIDIIIGDAVVSNAISDIRPLLDGRGLEFNPSAPNPGEEVTISAFFENAGTADTDRAVDAVLLVDGAEIARYRTETMEPTDPSGSAGFESFSVEWSGGLGEYNFELILDPYQNVTQSRYDNDAQSTTLTIVPPYNATFELPTNPVRVNPGESTMAQPTVRSTGRLAGVWTLAVDSSNLPSGWTWTDQTQGGTESIEISADGTWTPSLLINAPASAEGSDAGYLTLTLTLDEDENVSVTGILPVEANRTRGLSIRGPSGTTASTGYGLIGEYAKSWLIVENLGNANEDSISLTWDVTTWEDDTGEFLGLFDEEGAEIPALTLLAGEQKVISARVLIPSDVSVGDSVSTSLTMCVGVEPEESCQTVDLQFIAGGVVSNTDHQRSVPENTLHWTITADLPASTGALDWSISEAGMGVEDWIWSGSGSLTVNGDDITLQGTPGSRVSGTLSLELPVDAPPAFHTFSDSSNLGADYSLKISVEVLQIYRSSLTLVSPTQSPYMVEVNQPIPATVRLYNPGNGEDTYAMSHALLLDENITEDPGIQVTFSNPLITLSAGSLRTLPVEIILPESTPARIPVNIIILMTSQGNASISDSVTLTLEARQDHRWEIALNSVLGEVEDKTFAVNPGDSFIIEVNATNIGNLDDDISISGSGVLNLEGADSEDQWTIFGDNVSNVPVNESAELELIVEVPLGSWNGTTFQVSSSAYAYDVEIFSFTFTIEVSHITGWNAIAIDADLEIEPEGSQVSLTIVQEGNSPTRPYVSVQIDSEGWSVETPGDLPTLEPGETANLELSITPPTTARYGKSVELLVRLREGDGSSQESITIPLRVAQIHNFTLENTGNWIVSPNGGYPRAELRNIGNAPTTISLEVLSLPLGWQVSGPTNVVIGVGEVIGVPIEVIPSDDWDGSTKTIVINAQDEAGNQDQIILDTQYEDYSWGSSPIIVATNGDSILLNIHGTSPDSSVLDDVQSTLEWDLQGGWAWQANSPGSELIIDSKSTLPYTAYVIEPASRFATCSISGPYSSIFAECSISNGTEDFSYTMLLIDDEGMMLDSIEDELAANTLGQVNLSTSLWDPNPGMRSLTLRLLDERGFVIKEESAMFEIRTSDWNVGLVLIELDGEGQNQKIVITTKRENYHLLTDADCNLLITSGSHSETHEVVFTDNYPPKPEFARPSLDDAPDGTELFVTLQCAFPWDEDSDVSDNQATIILSGGSVTNQGGFEWGTALASAILVMGLASAIAWIAHNQRERRKLLDMTESILNKKKQETKLPKPPLPSENLVEESIQEKSIIENNEEIISNQIVEETPEVVERQLDDFESRLKRLTGDN